jgi:hypothetical protein
MGEGSRYWGEHGHLRNGHDRAEKVGRFGIRARIGEAGWYERESDTPDKQEDQKYT